MISAISIKKVRKMFSIQPSPSEVFPCLKCQVLEMMPITMTTLRKNVR